MGGDEFDEFDDDESFDADMLRAVDAIESRPPPPKFPPAPEFVRASTLAYAPTSARPVGRPGPSPQLPQQHQQHRSQQRPQQQPACGSGGGGGNKSLAAAIAAVSAVVPMFEDTPADAFDSSPETSLHVGGPHRRHHITDTASPPPRPRPSGQGLARSDSGALRQTTLFGTLATITDEPLQAQQQSRNPTRPFKADLPPQPKTKHELDWDALGTWVYPTNVGPIRDYQFSIVSASLFKNTLVALPTGLGKTFIAATVMLNFYRWTKKGKIVFVAPTKPLVSQQVDACFNIAGIPRSDTTHLNGEVSPGVRAEEWRDKRVFFLTPQTLQNDLSHGVVEPKSIALLVVDEAHRATGEYAYTQVVRYMRRFTNDFRVLALTATPGSTVEAVQTVLDNLGIAHVEIRTESSIDIQQYVHARDIDQVVLDHSDEILQVREMLTSALKPLTEKLTSQNMYYGRDPMNFSNYGLMMAQREWMNGPGRTANQGLKNMMRAVFGVLTSVAHPIKLLNFHGLRPFYDSINQLRKENEAQGEKGSKYKWQLFKGDEFTTMMDTVAAWLATDVVGHPKLAHMADTVLRHFTEPPTDSGEETKVIVFSEYRDSAEEIVRTLNAHRPLVRATVFVGQADSKRSEGMKQAQQLRTIQEFRDGVHNVLVATSIGEEGLDIGQVDLIICYDSSSSPIRMLQRMGRTGRKRAGKIVVLLMRGKEENSFNRSKETYEHMQGLICEGSRFKFRTDLSTRIVPNDVHPEVDKRHVEIPLENTQVSGSELPVPKRGRAAPKRPPKKFHMPEDVETGFQSVAAMLGLGSAKKKAAAAASKATTKAQKVLDETDDLVPIPELSAVMLNSEEEYVFRSQYTKVPGGATEEEVVPEPDFTAFPLEQRILQPVGLVKHGQKTKRCVAMLQKLARMQDRPASNPVPYGGVDKSRWTELPVPDFVTIIDQEERGSRKRPRGNAVVLDEDVVMLDRDDDREEEGGEEEEETRPAPPKRQRVAKTKPAPKKPAAPKRSATTRTKRPHITNPFILDSTSASMDGPASSSPVPGGRGRGRKNRGTEAAMRAGVNSDEVGDDCERDSDALESDGSDDGSDLADFLVSDDRELSVVEEEDEEEEDEYGMRDGGSHGGLGFMDSTLATEMTSRARLAGSRGRKRKGGMFVDAASSGDELPALQALMSTSPSQRTGGRQDSSDAPVVRKPARRRRVALDDSDE